jgi:hypothetical protein
MEVFMQDENSLMEFFDVDDSSLRKGSSGVSYWDVKLFCLENEYHEYRAAVELGTLVATAIGMICVFVSLF